MDPRKERMLDILHRLEQSPDTRMTMTQENESDTPCTTSLSTVDPSGGAFVAVYGSVPATGRTTVEPSSSQVPLGRPDRVTGHR
jgi:hypothetical protein